MKKLCLAVTAVFIGMLCVSASIWEGAAAVSISGEVPEGGYYVATKSFPRNTVVDITNLENSKTVRVIVAAGLDSPGLLAILSKEAADAIGIQPRSISRIRMAMPSEPIAFSRFTEGAASGDDPRAAIAGVSSGPVPQNPQQSSRQVIIPSGAGGSESGSMSPPNPPPSLKEWTVTPPPSVSPNRPIADPLIPPGNLDPSQNALWPWEQSPLPANPSSRPVESAPGSAAPEPLLTGEPSEPSPPPPVEPEPPLAVEPSPPSPVEPGPGSAVPEPLLAGEPIEPSPPPPVEPGPAAPEPLLAGEPIEPSPSLPVEPAPDPLAAEQPETPPPSLLEPAYRPPAAARQDSAIITERRPELSGEAASGTAPTERKSIVLEPADLRPPEPYASLPPEAEIAPISPPASSAVKREDIVRVPEEYIIPEIAQAPSQPKREEPVRAPQPETVKNDPAKSGFEKPVSQARAVQFSAPLISSLEKGMYYLQLRAYSRADLVQAELSRLGAAYPLAVQAEGSPEKPLYRILVGPV
ncbi:MAG: hypothetical protein LBP81_08550, partial [Treponema sp.]|nr:hypothetical protein [Treponema sp.]